MTNDHPEDALDMAQAAPVGCDFCSSPFWAGDVCGNCGRSRAALTQQAKPVPFAYYCPLQDRLRRNPLYQLTVLPKTAWVGEIPLYLQEANK